MTNLLLICEFIACITGFVYLRKLKGTFWIAFPIYLLCIVISEQIGNYLGRLHKYNENVAFFNLIEIPMEFLFFFWLFHKTSKSFSFNKLPIICAVIYITSWLTENILNWNTPSFLAGNSYTVGNLLLLILILRYFILLVTSDEILNFRTNRMFWVCSGLLLYYLGSAPFYGLRSILIKSFPALMEPFYTLVLVLNCIMYLMFAISFIWGKNTISFKSSS